MMNTLAALLLAIGVVLAALLHGGIYTVVAVGSASDYVGVRSFVVNRFTGSIVQCWPDGTCVGAPALYVDQVPKPATPKSGGAR